MLRAKILPVDRADEPFVPCSEIFLGAAEREMAAFVVAAKEHTFEQALHHAPSVGLEYLR